MTGALSPTHWLIILAVVLLLFGAKRLPDAARGLGSSLRIFKAETAALSGDKTESSPASPASSSEASSPALPASTASTGGATSEAAPSSSTAAAAATNGSGT